MSLENAKAFIEKVQGDKALQKEASDIGHQVDNLLALAKREGFECSEADFVMAVREAGYTIETRLSDVELQSVAGGTMGPTNANAECGETELDCPSTDWPDC